MRNTVFISTLLFFAASSFAQNFGEVPLPAAKQTEALVLLGGTAHIGNGQVIENSAIGFRDGKITFVADATTIKLNPAEARIIEIYGHHVYPGLIALNTNLGLTEIDAARPTRDYNEVGTMNPHIRALIAYNTDSRITPTVRSNGVLLAHIVPQGGTLSGESAVVNLDAWNYEDAVLLQSAGIHLNWPGMYSRGGWWAEPGAVTENKDYSSEVDQITAFFTEARAYAQTTSPQVHNAKFEAMRGLFSGTKKLFIHVDYARAIEAAIDFSKSLGLQIILVGAEDAYLVADRLKDENIPVILGATHALPSGEDADINQPYKTPSVLQDKGVLFAISISGSWQTRNLPFMAGTAAAYGLTAEEAIASVTSSPAKILGIADRVGTLELGKDATLVVSEGDLLDMRSSVVVYAFIEGRQIDLDDKQKQLYRRFAERYDLEVE
jgi:imidazolonepropionase-like amidohydrolase